MTHPLGLSPDYIPIDTRKRVTTVTVTDSSKSTVAKDMGLPPSIFSAKTKKNRAIHLLGKGDVAKGHRRYERMLKEVESAFLEACEMLGDMVRGYETFDSFTQRKYNTYALRRDTVNVGVHQYKKLIRIHRLLKDFASFQALRRSVVGHIALEDRVPLTKRFVMKYYWQEKMTSETLAKELVVPEGWIHSEIKRLGMHKKKNGVKLRGKKGFAMPEAQKVKHQNQPHAKAVVQIDPRSFEVLRSFNSTAAVERDGWIRENVRKAIKSAGLHDGFLWAYDGEEEDTVKRAKAKGNLERNLQIWENGHMNKEVLQDLYIDKNMSLQEVADKLGYKVGSVGTKVSQLGLTKRKNISDERLRFLYVEQGMTAPEIADQEGYTISTIRTYLSRRGMHKATA